MIAVRASGGEHDRDSSGRLVELAEQAREHSAHGFGSRFIRNVVGEITAAHGEIGSGNPFGTWCVT